jgi:hypothetical protein
MANDDLMLLSSSWTSGDFVMKECLKKLSSLSNWTNVEMTLNG